MLQKQSLSLTTCHWDVLKQGGKFSGVSQPPSIRASLHSVLASALLKNSLAVEGLHDFLSFQSVCGWRTSSILLVEKPPLRSTILEVRINNEIQLTYKCSYSAGEKYFPFSELLSLLHICYTCIFQILQTYLANVRRAFLFFLVSSDVYIGALPWMPLLPSLLLIVEIHQYWLILIEWAWLHLCKQSLGIANNFVIKDQWKKQEVLSLAFYTGSPGGCVLRLLRWLLLP